MATMSILKTNTPPTGVLDPHSLYFVADGTATGMSLYLADQAGTATRHTITQAEVDTKISEALGGTNYMYLTADMDTRDTLGGTLTKNSLVLVQSPQTGTNADATVTAGAAMYFFDSEAAPGSEWTKVYEAESLDVVLDYANIQNTPTLPTSTPAAIDTAVQTLTSLLATLTNLTSATEDANGNLIYNGQTLDNSNSVILTTTNW